ncbi:hypothetical protein F4803DRAFT_510728 [Xylaria telfairii]|nr:hypothetical protein F4803DRAFT_510728 [Xylaria telfairii]
MNIKECLFSCLTVMVANHYSISSVPTSTDHLSTQANMPTAKGTVTRPSANRLTFVFVIDGLQYTFNATVSPSIQPFTANNLTLTYTDVDQLTSTRSYSGRIGINDLNLKWDNGPEVTGGLNVPGISPASTVNGSGAWEQN